MSQFTLPSGKTIEIKDEPTYGEELKAAKVGLSGDSVDYLYAKFEVMVPSLSREEIDGLNREDGHALGREVARRYEGRPVDPTSPFGSTSTSEPTPEPTAS